MSDSLSNIPHIVICAADIDPDKIKPLLQERNDALDYLSVGEALVKAHNDELENKILKTDDGDKFELSRRDASRIFTKEEGDKLEVALSSLRKALLGEYDATELIKPPVSLDKIGGVKAAFEEVLKSLSYKARERIRTQLFHKEDNREERLEKSFETYMNQLSRGPVFKAKPPTKMLQPVIEDPKAWTYHGLGESDKPSTAPPVIDEEPAAKTVEDVKPMEGLVPVQWPKSPAEPKIKRVPVEDNEEWLKVGPAVSELVNLPKGKNTKLGEGYVDDVLRILDREVSLDDFLQQAQRLAPSYYHRTGLEERITQLRENMESAPSSYKDKLKKALTKAEDHLKHIQTLNTNLKYLYDNWTPESMKNKSNLVKNIGDSYKLVLGERDITLETTWLSASIKFPTVTAACKRFIELNTEKDVEATFDVATLIQLEKQANYSNSRRLEDHDEKERQLKDSRNDLCEHLSAEPEERRRSLVYGLKGEYDSFGPVAQLLVCEECWKMPMQKEAADLASIVKPNTKGPSAEEEKKIVDVITVWLNSSNIQGSEEDVTQKIAEYLNTNAPDYHDENVARVARKAYAEWKASQPIPSEVGQEGKPNVGVANADGTGVFIEPNRGNSNVQNEAPMAGVRKEASVKCLLCAKMIVSGSSEYRTLKGEVCNDHSIKDITIAMTAEEAEACNQCDMGAHERCTKGSCGCGCRKPTKEASVSCKCGCRESDHWSEQTSKTVEWLGGKRLCRNYQECKCEGYQPAEQKQATQEESIMVFNAGDTALLNTRVGALDEGTEVVVTSCSGDEVSFTAGDTLGITKVANLDKATITKEASSENEKYPWDNDGLKFKFELGDRVKASSIESDGTSLKGKEGTIRDKVIVAANGDAEKFYTVEFDGCGTATLPEESLSKAGKQPKREAALNHDEFTKEAVIKPNFDAVQEFLNSYDHPPTVVTTADIEAWMADPKNNYQYSKKDLKEFVKYLQSAKVEVRVPTKKEAPDVLPEEEMSSIEEIKKDAKKYKMEQTKPDGSKVTVEKEITQDMGPGFETEDPAAPGVKNKWVAASLVEASCSKCSGIGTLPCDCMDSALWLTNSCNKCKDEGAMPCPSCK